MPRLEAPLTTAEAEAAAVHKAVGAAAQPPLIGTAAAHDEVAGRLPTTSWVHFACHAVADQEDPSRSAIELFDQALSVAELAQMELPKAYLAFLSACTTATGSVRLLDESIHIAAFQLAGYPHVIATLWPIMDRMAPGIATRIYERMMAGASPAVAVHETVRDYRNRYRDHPQIWASHIHFGP